MEGIQPFLFSAGSRSTHEKPTGHFRHEKPPGHFRQTKLDPFERVMYKNNF